MLIKQAVIILTALFLGYSTVIIFNLPIPSNVMGLVILFAALCIGVIKVKQVDKVSDFIIRYLALFFVVPTVGIMQYFELIGEQFFNIIFPLILSTLIGFFVAAKTTEIIIRIREKKQLSAAEKDRRQRIC